ncbi:MAG: TBC domain-containing protein [archaeon]|nr:TBC domain-containing protein [archaeon]
MTKTNQYFNEDVSKKTYEELLSKADEEQEKILNISEDNLKQIIKDLNRTYPSVQMFKDEEMQRKLKNVLRAFSSYDRETCYFQGMNFIVGFFLYHCEEYVAFWLFVSLFDEYNFRELYSKDFAGLKKHSKRVKHLIQKYYPELNKKLESYEVNIEITMVEWLYSLFSSLIPLEDQMNFYFGFFSQGWKFFYKMCMSLFNNLNTEKKYTGAEDIYIALKYGKNDGSSLKDQSEYWKKIISDAYLIKIDDQEE